jgi:glycosyltransferase involved in cell wall biosynthesis
MTEPSCLFSVVIPTQGRFDLVEKLFSSLQRAITQSKVAVEIIIVDDSPQPERDEIVRLCQQYGARYLSGPQNVREKRNLGIEKSKGGIILFTDSDCEVTKNIFDEHLKLYTEADTAGVLGITEFKGKENNIWKIISRTMFLDSFSFAKTLYKVTDSAPWGTCTNLSFRKEVLENVGKFDTAFPFRLGGDDTELGVRNFFTVLFFIVFACLAYILTGHSDVAIMIIVVWMLSTLLIESIIKVIRAGEKHYFIVFEFMATLLNLIFDAGTIFESLRRGSCTMLYKRIIYTPALLIYEWESEVVRSWSIIIGLLLTLIVMWAIIEV